MTSLTLISLTFHFQDGMGRTPLELIEVGLKWLQSQDGCSADDFLVKNELAKKCRAMLGS